MLSMLEKPSKTVLSSMTGIAYLFAICAVIAAIAWIYYTAKAVEQNLIGDSDGNGDVLGTANTMFEAVVISVFIYFAFRHNFRCHY